MRAFPFDGKITACAKTTLDNFLIPITKTVFRTGIIAARAAAD